MAGTSRGSRWRPVGKGSGKGWMESTRDRFEDRGRLAVGSGSEGVRGRDGGGSAATLEKLGGGPGTRWGLRTRAGGNNRWGGSRCACRNGTRLVGVLPAHLAAKVFRAATRCGIWVLVVPAKLTWLIQPADTHAFYKYKMYLSLSPLHGSHGQIR